MCVLHLNKLHDIRCIHIYFYSPPIYILSRRYMMCTYIYIHIYTHKCIALHLFTNLFRFKLYLHMLHIIDLYAISLPSQQWHPCPSEFSGVIHLCVVHNFIEQREEPKSSRKNGQFFSLRASLSHCCRLSLWALLTKCLFEESEVCRGAGNSCLELQPVGCWNVLASKPCATGLTHLILSWRWSFSRFQLKNLQQY